MPKASTQAPDARQQRRHNPLSEDYAPNKPPKQKAGKKRKITQSEGNEDSFVDTKATRRILKSGQDLADEDQQEQIKAKPNPAFAFESRFGEGEVPDEGNGPFDDDENDEEAWGDDDEVVEEVEVDPNDRDIFNRFHPSLEEDPSHLFDPPATPHDTSNQGINLADLILEKIAAHEAATNSTSTNLPQTHPADPDPPAEDDIELPPKVIEVYTKIGDLLSRHRSGPLPKPFKILPSLPASQIPLLINLTRPDDWTPHVHFLATRLFISSRPSIAQPFLTAILLPRVRDDIHETKKLHVHLYAALKKSLYKPACFFKGFLFPLLSGDHGGECTLREAQIIGSVLSRVSIPVLHSAAALLRLCDIAAEQFSVGKEDGGGGATNIFIRVLLEKKYALPYKVVDALVFHFLRFRALQARGDDGADVAMSGVTMDGAQKGKLPVLWHQCLLAFAQRYRNDVTEDQREALMDLVNLRGHKAIGPEVRRELLEGRGRGVMEFVEGAVGRDDTMMVSVG